MLQLTSEEQTWLDAYREALNKKHPGDSSRNAHLRIESPWTSARESDVDIILIVKNGAKTLKRELRRIGYLLAAKTEVLPSILAYTKDEWESRRRSGSSFRKAVERDAVRGRIEAWSSRSGIALGNLFERRRL